MMPVLTPDELATGSSLYHKQGKGVLCFSFRGIVLSWLELSKLDVTRRAGS